MGLVIEDAKLQGSIDSFFEKLSKYYPEHKVFALDSMDSKLRERLTQLSSRAGYETVEAFLAEYGYELISGDEVKKIRSSVLYTPGNEPEIIKGKVESMLKRLNEYYPDHVIRRGIQNDHKKLSQSISGLYQWLGYADSQELLKAYGFEVAYENHGGRPTEDRQWVIDFLKEKYSDAPKPTELKDLIADNPEISGKLKTLNNESKKLFGMTFLQYLREQGILSSEKPEAKNSHLYNYLVVWVESEPDNIICATNVKTVSEGDYIKLCKSADTLIGRVLETHFCCKEEDLPVPVEEIYLHKYMRKVSVQYLVVSVEGHSENYVCATDIKTICREDYVEISDFDTNENYIGRVIKTYSFGIDEAVESASKMCGFIRRLPKTEAKSFEAARLKYLFCKVKISNNNVPYYISPFKDVKANDIVKVPHYYGAIAKGVVTDVILASENTAPNPVKKTSEIVKIIGNTNDEAEMINKAAELLADKWGTEAFTKTPVDTSIVNTYEKTAYFASAVFRGLDVDVCKALSILHPDELFPMDEATRLEYGVSQFECKSADVPQIVSEFPNLKAVFFAEDWKNNDVYLAYSESGYDTVTELRFLDKCNFYCRDRWTLLHDPTEEDGPEYHFDERTKWESGDYVLPDGERRLTKIEPFLSSLYKKAPSFERRVIKIKYPENEKIYEEPAKVEKKPTTNNSSESGSLKGMTFVVTGDLHNYSSRDELKKSSKQKAASFRGACRSKPML